MQKKHEIYDCAEPLWLLMPCSHPKKKIVISTIWKVKEGKMFNLRGLSIYIFIYLLTYN